MNIDVEFHIRHNYPWSKLPANVRQVWNLGPGSRPAVTCSPSPRGRGWRLWAGSRPSPAQGLEITYPQPAGEEGTVLGPQGQDGAVSKWDGMVSSGLACRLRTQTPFNRALR